MAKGTDLPPAGALDICFDIFFCISLSYSPVLCFKTLKSVITLLVVDNTKHIMNIYFSVVRFAETVTQNGNKYYMHLIYHCNKDHQHSDFPQKPSRKMQSVSLTSFPKPNHSNSTKFNGNSNPSDNINFYCQKTSAENNINCHLLMHGMPATPIYIAHSGRQRPQTGVI